VSLLPSQNQTFTATVSGTSNTAVTWSINPASASLVSGATTAVYVAPSTAPTTQSGTLTATSMADPSKIATALITLLQAITVSLSPSTVSLAPSGTQQFTATVLGTSNTAVTWSINPSVGTISSAGLYTAPASVLTAQTVTVTAQSVADPTKSASGVVSAETCCTFYVDNAGSNSNNGTTPATAWQTIAKVNATTLTPGQSVGFKAGGTWRESLIPGQSGSAGNPITFASYGTGAQPIINGSNLLSSGWTQNTTNVWKVADTTKPNVVWFNGTAGTQMSSAAAIVAPYDWYWASNVLYVWAPGNVSPATTYINPGVEAATRTSAVSISLGYITLSGLHLVKSNEINLFFSAANNVTVYNCTNEYGAGDGVTFSDGSNNIVLNGGAVDHNGENGGLSGLDGDGIGIGNGGDGSHDITIENMNIYSNGNNTFGDNVTTSVTSTGAAPYNILIKNNTISNANGNSGLTIYAGTAITVQYNLIFGNHYRGVQTYNIHPAVPISLYLYNNTIVGNMLSAGAALSNDSGTEALTMKNNIIWDNVSGNSGAAMSWSNVGAGTTTLFSDYNDIYNTLGWSDCYYGGSYISFAPWQTDTGLDSHSISSNPLFTNAGAGDYTLQSGSPAIGAGVYIPGVSTANPPNMGAK
jgi:hypothetical protein